MAPPYPTQGILRDVFQPQSPLGQPKARSAAKPSPSKKIVPTRFTAWSAADDVKSRANTLSEEAQKEIAKASSKAQATAGKIELYSPKYYAACIFGGLVACVSHRLGY